MTMGRPIGMPLWGSARSVSSGTMTAVGVSVLISAAFAAALQLLPSAASEVLSDVGLLLAALAASALLWRAGRKRRGRDRAGWWLLALSALSWALGEATWDILQLVLGRELPFPSLADIAYAGAVPIGLFGLLMLRRAVGANHARLLLDGWLVAAGVLVVVNALVLAPQLAGGPHDLLRLVLGLGYPVGDVLLLTVAVTAVRLGPRAERGSRALLVLAFGAMAVADFAYAPGAIADNWFAGDLSDPFWLLGYLLLASAGLRQARAGRSGELPVLQVTRATVLLPPVVLASAGTVLILGALLGRKPGGLEVGVAVSVLVALALRQTLTSLDNAALTRELLQREDLFRSLVQGSSDVITVWDSDGAIRYCSPAVTRVFGSDPDELLGSHLESVIHPDDVPAVRRALRGLEDESVASVRFECRVEGADGVWRATESTASDHRHNPSVRGLVFNTRDVSDRDALREQLVHLAYHDPLTELPNRTLFRDRVGQSLLQRRAGQAPVAVLFLDLDGFKAVNDSAGHAVGDELLRQCSLRLRTALRGGDTVARLGGDEFAALLDDSSLSGGALEVAQRVLAALSEPFDIAGRSVVIGASLGIAFGATDADADELLRNADLAMYRAKAAGKGRIEVFAPEMHQELVQRVEVEADVRRGLTAGEFFLAYQPVVDLRTGQVVEVEALLRWQHPERGLVSPVDFIGVAEETGLIVPLGRFALQEACRQLARWRRAGHQLGVAVNLSARQIQAPGLVDTVAAALRAHGLPATSLTLEITENVLVDHDERTVAKIELLRELGVRLAIDDFGTGYSSLAYLRRFPVDVLKVDRSFVSGVGQGGDLTALTSTIVRLGRELGLTLVAEGIEDAVQLDALLAMGCHRGQGYLFSRPTTPEAIAMLLREGGDLVADHKKPARTSAV
ncbi:MAG: hypothetical protein QOK42_754 [Frankiaceae bacterium]|nr:hypothetical protein [Frankiaceae bacterium]